MFFLRSPVWYSVRMHWVVNTDDQKKTAWQTALLAVSG